MLVRSAKMFAAVTLVAILWALSAIRQPGSSGTWLHPAGTSPGPVRILRFYATSGIIQAGETTQLCYGVENAKTVRISPPVAKVAPASRRCLDIVPLHTTHYTLLAEGYDGRVVVQSLTLPVERTPKPRPQAVEFASCERRSNTSRTHKART